MNFKNFFRVFILVFSLTIISSIYSFADIVYSPGSNPAEKRGPDSDVVFYDSPIPNTTIDKATSEIISQIVVSDQNVNNTNHNANNINQNVSQNVATPVNEPISITTPPSNATNLPSNTTIANNSSLNSLTLPNLTTKTLVNAKAPEVSSPTYAIINATTREIYAVKDQNTKYDPSGLANLMTAYIALQYLKLDSTLTVKASAVSGIDKDASIAALRAGDKITLKDAIASMFVKGCVDSANVIAENVSSSKSEFVNLMNATALSLGLSNTKFVDPAGILKENETTALDMAIIMGKVCENPELVNLLSLFQYTLPATSKREKLILYSRNTQLNKDASSYNADIAASRLAYTSNSKFCIASMMNVNGNHIVVVILKTSGTQFSDTKKILEFGKLALAE